MGTVPKKGAKVKIGKTEEKTFVALFRAYWLKSQAIFGSCDDQCYNFNMRREAR